MAKIIIFGTGDIAQIANYYFDIDTEHEVVAFTVDKNYITTDEFEGKPVVDFEQLSERYPPSDYQIFIATSYAKLNKVREEKYNEVKKKGYHLVSYISSKCSYLSQYECGDNCFILEDNTIQPFVKLGNNITLWSGNHIGHHSIIHDHNFISSHVVISGHCEVHSNCFIGVNATLHNNVVISKETILAAGAIISKKTIEKGVYLPPQTTLFKKKSDELNF
ncbi:acetyltransferase [Pedobacter arcticus]|uniref:acetyltransferase n=1 Tax=Pedobacter arcticus TaxID=752140 RepID=UPI0002F0F066|nr:acetyltransferase [Pedobacter arcticus]